MKRFFIAAFVALFAFACAESTPKVSVEEQFDAFNARMSEILAVVDIDGIGKAIVLDRGSAITGNDLDLLVNTNPWDFGRKYKQTKVLRLGW